VCGANVAALAAKFKVTLDATRVKTKAMQVLRDMVYPLRLMISPTISVGEVAPTVHVKRALFLHHLVQHRQRERVYQFSAPRGTRLAAPHQLLQPPPQAPSSGTRTAYMEAAQQPIKTRVNFAYDGASSSNSASITKAVQA
jgi:hypothetical protein